MTRILMCHPGATVATADVYTGYRDALRRAGVEIIEYLLDDRLEVAKRHLTSMFAHADRHLPKAERRRPTEAHIQWQACNDMIPRALWHKVDFVLHVSCQYLHPDFLVLLRRANIPNVAILTESPYADDYHEKLLPYIDVAFVNERTSVERLRRVNSDVYYIPCGYDPAHHYPGAGGDDDDTPAHDVVFVGTAFQERIDLLAGVDWTGIDLGLYGTWNLLGSRHPLRRFVRGKNVSNARAVQLYRKAKINLNLYRTSAGYGTDVPQIDHAESMNPRAVELAACGLFHMSQERAEVWDTFNIQFPYFSTSKQLEEKIRFYLRNPGERDYMASLLPSKVAHLTFDAHARTMATTLAQLWGGERIQAQAAD